MLLALLSFCMVGTWVYHLHDKLEYSRHPKIIYVQEKAPAPKLDSARINGHDAAFSDTTNLSGDTGIQGMITLRNEIAYILSDSHLTRSDLAIAEEKIGLLQRRIARLTGNEKLLNKDSVNSKADSGDGSFRTAEPVTSVVHKDQDRGETNASVSNGEKPPRFNLASTFSATMISLRGIAGNELNSAVTMSSSETDHLSIIFYVKNLFNSFKNTSLYVVLLDPAGNIIEDDAWEAGMVMTSTEGNIHFTRKLTVEYNRGDTKKVELSIRLPRFPEGLYKLRIYHNGQRIGRASLRLS